MYSELNNGCPIGPNRCQYVLEFPAGSQSSITYTATNGGSWGVRLDECADHTVDVWTTPATSGWPPFRAAIVTERTLPTRPP